MARHVWTQAQDDIIKARFPMDTAAEIATAIGCSIAAVHHRARKLGVKKSDAFWKSEKCARLNGKQGAQYRFAKGVTSWNAGKQIGSKGRSAETQFKPGQRSHNYRPVGSERVRSDGYLERKVSDTGYPPKDWKTLHVILWESVNGPVPKGHVLVFIDGNKRNIVIENLSCITLAENARRNSIHRYPPELRQAMRTLGRLKSKIRSQEHGNEKQN